MVTTAAALGDLTSTTTTGGQVPPGKFPSVETTKKTKAATATTIHPTEESGRSTADIFLSAIIPLEQTTKTEDKVYGTNTEKIIQLSYFISYLYYDI